MEKLFSTCIISFLFASLCHAELPSLTTDEVKQEVLQTAKNVIAEKIAARTYTQITGVPTQIYQTKINCKWLKSRNDPDSRKVLAAIDKAVANMQIKLENIQLIKPSGGMRHSSPFCCAQLKIDKRKWNITWRWMVDSNSKSGLKLHISGLDKIYCGPPPLSQQKIKPLPYDKTVAAKVEQLEKTLYKIPPQGEFESREQHRAKVLTVKIKAYKEFKKTGIADNVYEHNFSPIKGAEIGYDPTRSCLNYSPVIYLLKEAKYDVKHLAVGGDGIDVNFAGVLKTPANQVHGYLAFYCTVQEAKTIKEKLDNSWECYEFKLWLKFDLYNLEWKLIKIFILPDKE